jgi:hypothetical protein
MYSIPNNYPGNFYIQQNYNPLETQKIIDLYCYEELDSGSPQMDGELNPLPQPLDKEMAKPEIGTLSQEEFQPSKTIDVEVMTQEELYTKLSQNIPLSPNERFVKLKSLFTFIPARQNDNEYWNLWLEIPGDEATSSPTYVNLLIEEDEYDSQCFPEARVNFRSYNLNPFLSSKSYYIKACEENNDNNYYFQLRIDPSFETSEIVHLQRGAGLSGTDIKKLILYFLDYIRPSFTYLHDDAKIISTDHPMDIALRVLLPIVSDQPNTWYSKDGFYVAHYQNLLNSEGNYRFPQDANLYPHKVTIIRNTCLKDLRYTHRLPAEYVNEVKLFNWIKTYIPNNPSIKKETWSYTVHELAKAMDLVSREASNKNRSKAALDLKKFYLHILQEKPFFPPHYNDALKILHNYQLWVRNNHQRKSE